MWNPISEQAVMADFWAPRPNGVWRKVLTPLRKFYLKKFYAVKEVTIEGAEHLSAVREGDGVMLTPNHSHDSDPHVMMEVAKRLDKQFTSSPPGRSSRAIAGSTDSCSSAWAPSASIAKDATAAPCGRPSSS